MATILHYAPKYSMSKLRYNLMVICAKPNETTDAKMGFNWRRQKTIGGVILISRWMTLLVGFPSCTLCNTWTFGMGPFW